MRRLIPIKIQNFHLNCILGRKTWVGISEKAQYSSNWLLTYVCRDLVEQEPEIWQGFVAQLWTSDVTPSSRVLVVPIFLSRVWEMTVRQHVETSGYLPTQMMKQTHGGAWILGSQGWQSEALFGDDVIMASQGWMVFGSGSATARHTMVKAIRTATLLRRHRITILHTRMPLRVLGRGVISLCIYLNMPPCRSPRFKYRDVRSVCLTSFVVMM